MIIGIDEVEERSAQHLLMAKTKQIKGGGIYSLNATVEPGDETGVGGGEKKHRPSIALVAIKERRIVRHVGSTGWGRWIAYFL